MALSLPRPVDLRHPLIERDYTRLCSRPAAFLHRSLAVAGCGAVVLFAYGATVDRQSPDQVGRMIHGMFSWMAMLFTFGLALTESALAVPVERSAGTLTALLTVPLSPRRLAVGFLASRVLLAFTMLLAVLPVEGMALLVGGVSLGDLGYSLASILVAVIFGAGIGFLAGHGSANGRLAVVRAGSTAAGLLVLVPLALALGRHLARLGWYPLLPDGGRCLEESLKSAALWAMVVTPVGPLLQILGELPPGFSASPGATLAIAAGTAAAWNLLALLVAGRRLRAETEVSSAVEFRGGFRAWVRRLLRRGPAPEAEEDLSLDFHPRVWKRPLLWKESRPPRGLAVRWGIRAVYAGIFGLYAWLFFSPLVRKEFTGTENNEMWAYDLFIAIPLWLLVLVVALPAATFLAEEREKGSLDLLRAAPLGARTLILSRSAGILLRTSPLFATFLLFGILGVFRGQVHSLTLPATLLGVAPVLAFLVLLSFQRGITAPSIRVANRRAGLLLTVMVGYPICCGMAVGLLRLEEWAAGLPAADPLAAMAAPMILLVDSYETWHPSGRTNPALSFGVTGCVFLAIWGILALLLWKMLPRMLRTGLEDEGKR